MLQLLESDLMAPYGTGKAYVNLIHDVSNTRQLVHHLDEELLSAPACLL